MKPAVYSENRMRDAIARLNEALERAGLPRLDAQARAALRDDQRFREEVRKVEVATGAQQRLVLQLLEGWHAWHGGS